MIPLAQITQWRNIAPWPDNMQIEQDLILSRVLVSIFSNPSLNKALAFRGGTALYKLFFNPAARYSEDIDLVRTDSGSIGEIVDILRDSLDSWLGTPKTSRTNNSFKINYHFSPEGSANIKQRIKIEINIREYFSCFDRISKKFEVNSDWFTGTTYINTYQFTELIATKLRALYQRRKGRDLFDLWLALKHKDFDIDKIIEAFEFYMKKEGRIIRRDDFIKNIEDKLENLSFIGDIGPLLSPELKKSHSFHMVTQDGDFIVTENGKFIMTEGWNLYNAAEEIKEKILAFLPV